MPWYWEQASACYVAHRPRPVTLRDYVAEGAKAFYFKLLDPVVGPIA